MNMEAVMNAMKPSIRALARLMEGAEEPGVRIKVDYLAFAVPDVRLIEHACQVSIAQGRDAVVALFDPDDIEGGVKHIGVALDRGSTIKLQFGRLWMARHSDRAVLVPRNVGKGHGHFAFQRGRYVNRPGWPLAELARGTERAEARLAELTCAHALGRAA
jgi:hypothetical protein